MDVLNRKRRHDCVEMKMGRNAREDEKEDNPQKWNEVCEIV